MRLIHVLAAVVLASLGYGADARGQDPPTTTAMTMDRRHLLVSKQVEQRRWSISVNLEKAAELGAPAPDIVSITGNAYEPNGDANFVHCTVAPPAAGVTPPSLDDPDSTFTLRCKGTGVCSSEERKLDARECARTRWDVISRTVMLPASFFLPDGGFAPSSQPVARAQGEARHGSAETGSVRQAAGTPQAENPNDGSTLSIDLLSYLVTRPAGDDVWSVALHMERSDGSAEDQVQSVVGIQLRGEALSPALIECQPLNAAQFEIDETENLQLDCFQALPCSDSALECAAPAHWQSIASNLAVPTTFFLPEGGSGLPKLSDADIDVIGGAAGLPGFVSQQCHLPTKDQTPHCEGNTACTDGTDCIVDRIGICENVRGAFVHADGRCRCFVPIVPTYCLRAAPPPEPTPANPGDPRIVAACGAPCELDVGRPDAGGFLRKARGVSLPLAGSVNCFCHANGSNSMRPVVTCGGPDATACPSDGGPRCCVDDPRDGCSPLDGDVGCLGLCVASVLKDGTCDAFDERLQVCGDGVVTGTEACEAADPASQTCEQLHYSSGTLSCESCRAVGCGGDSQAKPQILVDQNLPAVLDEYWRYPVRGRYLDGDGDVAWLVVRNGAGAELRRLVLNEEHHAEGAFEAAFGCSGQTGDPIDRTIEVVDADGSSSDIRTIKATCAEPTCGNEEPDDGEPCDYASDAARGGCGADELCARDCSCRPSDSCSGRCCPTGADFCTPDDASVCRCDPGCGANCCADVKLQCGYP